MKPSLWRVDGKTLIQKYECIDDEGLKYKNVSTYSGWTAKTRNNYKPVTVKVIKSAGQYLIVERLKDVEENHSSPQNDAESEELKMPAKNSINFE